MIKNNKGKLIASSVIILLPVLFGLIFWNMLPEKMTTNWGIDGSADGWSSRSFGVLFIPLFMLASHWFCIFCTVKDPKNKGLSNKVFGMVIWICPLASLFSSGIIYASSFGWEPKVDLIGIALFGLMFVIIGNYLPKCKQNYTIGIRVKWALENEENWNRTHRFSSRVWVIGGLVMIASVFLPRTVIPWITAASVIAFAVVPITYSYLYYRKQLKEGTAVFTPVPQSKGSKALTAVLLIFTGAILIFTGIMMFAGDITVKYDETSFTVEASIWNDLKVNYENIESIEYREQDNAGDRTNGLGNVRLQAGTFRNGEFGNYTRYSYVGCDDCVVIKAKGKTIVINGKDKESTQCIYNELMARTQLQM